MFSLSKLAERQILKALAEGKLDNLAGAGKPLVARTGDAFISAGEAVGFRMMAESGALPEEIVLKKQLDAQRSVLAGLSDAAERKAAMAKLADLEMRQAIAQDARRRFMKD